MAVVKKFSSGTTGTWGCDGSSGVDYGIITDSSEEYAAERDALPNQTGETVGMAIYDKKTNITLSVVIKDAAVFPAVGDNITLNGVTNCLVESISKEATQKGWKKATIKATKFVSDLT